MMKLYRYYRILSVILIVSFLLSLSACQPPDYGEMGLTSETESSPMPQESSSSESENIAPFPFGSKVPYFYSSMEYKEYTYLSASLLCYGQYFYTLEAYKIFRTDRETNMKTPLCLETDCNQTCILCQPENSVGNMQIVEDRLYFAVYVPSVDSATSKEYCAYIDLKNGEYHFLDIPDLTDVWLLISDGYLYYKTFRMEETTDENTGKIQYNEKFEFWKRSLDGTESERLVESYRAPVYIYHEIGYSIKKGYSIYGEDLTGLWLLDLHTGEETPILRLKDLGAEEFERVLFREQYAYISVASPLKNAQSDLYRLNLETGECEKILECIGAFCIMEEGIYYRVPGDYKSNYKKEDGTRPNRFERDLYRCNLDGSNSEVVFSNPDMVFHELDAVIDGYAYGTFLIMTSAKKKIAGRFALHLATGTYQEILDPTLMEP